MREIVIIVAMSKDRVIGKDGKIPWYIPEDLKRFKELTSGCPIIMGRVTFESLPVKPLPCRKNIVITTQKGFKFEGVTAVQSFKDALSICSDDDKVFIIGGERLYRDAIEIATSIELTIVDGDFDGDRFFPEIDLSKWKLVSEDKHNGYTFKSYARKID